MVTLPSTEFGCDAPKVITGCWSPGAPKMCINGVVKQGRARYVGWACLTDGCSEVRNAENAGEIHGSFSDCNQDIRQDVAVKCPRWEVHSSELIEKFSKFQRALFPTPYRNFW